MGESKSELAAPKHLRRATREFYARMQATYSMEEHQLRTLLLGCEAFDRCVEAREELAKAGTYQTGRYGQAVTHPAVKVEEQARLAWLRCIRELGLPDEEPPGTPRPPKLSGRYVG